MNLETKYMLALLEKIARNTTGTAKHTPIDVVQMISATTPWILDYKERRHIYIYSPNSLTLTIEDFGSFALSASTWMNIDFLEGMHIFASGQTNNVAIFVRCTDELLSAVTLPMNLIQINGTAISNTNPEPVQFISQAGYIALSTPAAQTNNGSDTTYTFSSQVNTVIIQNNTTVNVNYAFDVAASAGSLLLLPGQLLVYSKKITAVHLFTAAAQNVNGTSAANIVLLGEL
jgi:hypothetical protein